MNVEIKITNPSVIEFYKNNPKLDIDCMNLLLIDLYKKMIEQTSNNITENQIRNIFDKLTEQKQEYQLFKVDILNKLNINEITTNTLKETLQTQTREMLNTITTKLYEIKQNYIDDVKLLLCSNNRSTSEIIINKMEKDTLNMINKINEVLNTTTKNKNEYLTDVINIMIKDIETTIKTNNITSDKIQNIIDNKYNDIIQIIQQNMNNNINTLNSNFTEELNKLQIQTTVNHKLQNNINNELQEYLNKYRNSTQKGILGEIKLENVLNKLYGTSEIINTTGCGGMGDFIVKRHEKPNILFENKEYSNQVDKCEIIKFINDCENNNMSGILISNYSGISGKKNYQIDIHKNNILIYINFAEYNPEKISVAVDIIDDLYKKINLVNVNIINDNILEYINNEYSIFTTKKESLVTYLKETNRKTIDLLSEIELPTLCSMLSDKYATTKMNNYTCTICNKFSGKNKAALGAHKKFCGKPKKINSPTSSEDK